MHRIAIGALAMCGENSDILNSHRYNSRTIAIGYLADAFPGTSVNTNQGNGVYIGPNSVIQMGVRVGDKAIIGAMSFVNKDVPNNSKWYGKSLK